MGTVRTAEPGIEPVTVAELKNHLRISDDADNSTLTGLIEAARQNVEHRQKRQHITATYELTLDEFPAGAIVLPWPPLISIGSITYLDTAGDSQTWASDNYQTDTTGERGSVCPVPSASYPSTEGDRKNAVTVTFDAGYGTTAADVPRQTRLAITMLAAHWYENREPVVVGTIVAQLPLHVESLIDANALKFF